MKQKLDNDIALPVGFALPKWNACRRPPHTSMIGNYCRVEILNPETHAESLYESYIQDKIHTGWTYLPYGPFDCFESFYAWLKTYIAGNDPLFHAIIDLKTTKALGIASYLRIEPSTGVIEVGHIHYSPTLQKTPIATEAMYLMMCRIFDELKYRRYEWKCDALNAKSQKAAQRLGFTFEGIFRQATIYKNRNRDTAWYSMIDREWPMLKKVYQTWLDTENFDAQGQQKQSLDQLMNQFRK